MIRGAADSARKMPFGKAFAMLAAHAFLCLAGELCAALTEIGWARPTPRKSPAIL